MKKIGFNPKYLYILLVLLLWNGCYKDKSNYEYVTLPELAVDLGADAYTRVLTQDSLIIDPIIQYDGDIADLRYEWQIFKGAENGFVTLQESRVLRYKVVPDAVVTRSGTYYVRLAVANTKSARNDLNPRADNVYSDLVTLTIVDASFRGLMVLHGDGQYSDIGLIEDNLFLPAVNDQVNRRVTPDFHSSFNNGEKIPGIGRQVFKQGWRFTQWNLGVSHVYAFTDQAGMRADFLLTQKTPADYSALYSFPEMAPRDPRHFAQRGRDEGKVVIDGEQAFYGGLHGPLMYAGRADTYKAAPFALAMALRQADKGAIIFDTTRKAFLFSSYTYGTSVLKDFPTSVVNNVALQPNNMQADLLYMDLRSWSSVNVTQTPSGTDAIAIMKDEATGEQYLANFNFFTTDNSRVAVGRYSMAGLPGLEQIRHYAFGSGVNLNFYATERSIYHYLYLAGNVATEVFSVSAGEKITMMRLLKNENQIGDKSFYKFSNEMLIVGTTDVQGFGKIYALRLNPVSGALELNGTFDGTESGGQRFGHIYDANLKDQ